MLHTTNKDDGRGIMAYVWQAEGAFSQKPNGWFCGVVF